MLTQNIQENKGPFWPFLLACIIFWVVVCGIVFGDDAYYDYSIIKTKFIKVTDENGDRIVPDVPCRLYSYYAVSEGKDITYSKDLKLEGKEIIACVAVKHEDKDKIKGLVVGEGFDAIKAKADYTKHFPFTIADMKRKRDIKTNEIIEYEGADKDDPARFCMWDE